MKVVSANAPSPSGAGSAIAAAGRIVSSAIGALLRKLRRDGTRIGRGRPRCACFVREVASLSNNPGGYIVIRHYAHHQHNLAPSLWAQPVWTPAQAEELSWRSMSKRGSTLASRRTPFTVQAMASPQGPPPPSPETGSIRWRGFWRAGPTRRTLGRRLLVRVGADPIHHQPPQPGHLGAQGLVVSRRYCRKSSRLMSARRGMSTITFNTWASFSVLCGSERAAAVGRLTELRYRRLSGGRGMQNWQGTWALHAVLA
jgi:hypothetical protein